MRYAVQVVGDEELPAGRHVVIVDREDGSTLMLVNGPPARTWALMREYEDARESHTGRSTLEPLRLVV